MMDWVFLCIWNPHRKCLSIGINRHLIFYISHSVQFVGVITAVFSTS